jgi:hypothetical protein
LLAQSPLVTGTCCSPDPVEDGTPLCIELLDGKHRDVAVLWIDPGGRRSWEEKKARHNRERPHHRSLQQTGAGKHLEGKQSGHGERTLWLLISPSNHSEGFIPGNLLEDVAFL